MENVKVIDNFLSDKEYNQVVSTIFKHDFPWTFGPILDDRYKTGDDKNDYKFTAQNKYNFQFCHILHFNSVASPYFTDIFGPIGNTLKPESLVNVKINLNPLTDSIVEHALHTDNPYKNSKTAIYYINTCDGYTLFEDGSKVESVANRLVTFPTNTKHTGTTTTNCNARCVININYFKD